MRERPPHPSLRPVCALYRIRFMVCAIREGTAVGSAAAAAIPIAHVLWSRPHPKCRRHLAFRFVGGHFWRHDHDRVAQVSLFLPYARIDCPICVTVSELCGLRESCIPPPLSHFCSRYTKSGLNRELLLSVVGLIVARR